MELMAGLKREEKIRLERYKTRFFAAPRIHTCTHTMINESVTLNLDPSLRSGQGSFGLRSQDDRKGAALTNKGGFQNDKERVGMR